MQRDRADADSIAEGSRGLVVPARLRPTCEDSLSTRYSSRRAWSVAMLGNPGESPMGQGLPSWVRVS